MFDGRTEGRTDRPCISGDIFSTEIESDGDNVSCAGESPRTILILLPWIL